MIFKNDVKVKSSGLLFTDLGTNSHSHAHILNILNATFKGAPLEKTDVFVVINHK